MLFFFNDTATTEIYTLSLHDALPIYLEASMVNTQTAPSGRLRLDVGSSMARLIIIPALTEFCEHYRSEEHTSELQSPCNLVCRLLLEKKKKKNLIISISTHTHIYDWFEPYRLRLV